METVNSHRPWYRRIAWTLLMAGVVAMLLSVAACSSDEEPTASTDPKSGGSLKVGILAGFITFDIPLMTSTTDVVTMEQVYDKLIMRNPDDTLQPMLAESWQSNEDASQWTFNLRRGVKFHHGKEFKAEDVVYSINRIFEVDSPFATTLTKPDDIVAVDDYTVRFEFPAPNAVLLDALVRYQAHITPSDVDPSRFAKEEFGTGPFIMTEFVPGERTSFKKNPDYWWEGHPLVDELTFVFLPSPEARIEALKAGIVDVIYPLDTPSAPGLQGNPDIVLSQSPLKSYMNLAMDNRIEPFNNKLVRKAIQAATDRERIVQAAQFGMGGIAYDHPVPPNDPVFNPNCKPPDYDPALAKDLLTQAGYPNGIDLTLHTASAGGAMVEMSTVLKESFAPAGINLDIVVMSEDGYWVDGWLVKPFTTVFWFGRNPYEAFSIVYHSDGAWNESFWNNPEADALMKQSLGAADLESRKEIFGKLQCIMVEEVPRIVAVFQPWILGLRAEVRDLVSLWDGSLSLHRAWLDR